MQAVCLAVREKGKKTRTIFVGLSFVNIVCIKKHNCIHFVQKNDHCVSSKTMFVNYKKRWMVYYDGLIDSVLLEKHKVKYYLRSFFKETSIKWFFFI